MNFRTITCFITVVVLSGCTLLNDLEIVNPAQEVTLLKSDCPRLMVDAPAPDVAAVVEGNNAFGWSLFGMLNTSGDNLFFSPYSISLALAMAWAGARGETGTEMEQALRYAFDDSRQSSAMNTIDRQLESRGEGAAGREGEGFALQLANALWGEKTYTFLQSYLDPLAQYFGAGMRLCDFLNDAEGARLGINGWVEEQTRGKIKDLIPAGVLNALTRLVITNTVYFDAAWADTFDANDTREAVFHRSASDSLLTLFMSRTAAYNYSEDQEFKALELPYDGDEVSMVVVMPRSTGGPLPSFAEMKALVAGLAQKRVEVSLPKFSFTWGTKSVKNQLNDLGMRLAFTDNADFSGIGGVRELFISDVLHQAFVAVDEKGTTAAAATAVIIGNTCIPPQPEAYFVADHPFVFFIRDIPTGQILFIGYVAAPASAS
ncbi:MAG: serpin family protein [Chitinispirillaceae bacterium]|nr:serpin family protein [Chitinispirillaceae bacterium]